MHSMIGVHIQQCDWQALGRQIWEDKRAIPKVFGKEEYVQMSKALEEVENRYFLEIGPYKSIPNSNATSLTIAHHKKLQTNYLERKVQRPRSERSSKDVGIQCDWEENEKRKMRNAGEARHDDWQEEEDDGFSFETLF